MPDAGDRGGDVFEEFEAIEQLKARYCRTMDTKDWQGMDFTPAPAGSAA